MSELDVTLKPLTLETRNQKPRFKLATRHEVSLILEIPIGNPQIIKLARSIVDSVTNNHTVLPDIQCAMTSGWSHSVFVIDSRQIEPYPTPLFRNSVQAPG